MNFLRCPSFPWCPNIFCIKQSFWGRNDQMYTNYLDSTIHKNRNITYTVVLVCYIDVQRVRFQLVEIIGKLNKGNLLNIAELHQYTVIWLGCLLTRSSYISELRRDLPSKEWESFLLIKWSMNKHIQYWYMSLNLNISQFLNKGSVWLL